MALAAGISRATINPPLDIPSGMWMAQRHVRGEGLDMDITATALVLADNDLRVAILDFDLCFLSDAQSAAIREAVGTAIGIPTNNVLPFCSHTHAGPVTLEYYRGEGEDRVRAYTESLPHLAAGAARRAAQGLQPVRVAGGNGTRRFEGRQKDKELFRTDPRGRTEHSRIESARFSGVWKFADKNIQPTIPSFPSAKSDA